MILLKEFLELVGNEPTSFTLTREEYLDLSNQETIQKKLLTQKLQMKFDENPNTKNATALSNNRYNYETSPVLTCWLASPAFLTHNKERQLRQNQEISGYIKDIVNIKINQLTR